MSIILFLSASEDDLFHISCSNECIRIIPTTNSKLFKTGTWEYGLVGLKDSMKVKVYQALHVWRQSAMVCN